MFSHRLVLVSGKGGVGRSAVAAALALAASRAGRRTLALALSDGLGLAAHLRSGPPSYDPEPVRPGLWLAGVSRSRALDEYLKLQLRVPQAAPTRHLTSALDLLVDTAPGVREIVSIGKPVYEVWRDTWDLVVVDAPPLGQLESYLRAPETIAGLVPSGTVRAQAGRIGATLADPAVAALVLVVTPAELPVTETLETVASLAEDPPIAVAAVVANRVLEPLEVPAEALAAVPAGPHRDAALLHLGLAAGQERWLARLPPGPRLPFLFGLLTPGEVAAQLAVDLERPR